MSLAYALALVASYVAIWILSARLYGRADRRLEEASEAIGAVLRHAPGSEVVASIISADQDSALVRTKSGALYLVLVVGRSLVVRDARGLIGCVTRRGDALRMKFSDAGLPPRAFRIAGDAEEDWVSLLKPKVAMA